MQIIWVNVQDIIIVLYNLHNRVIFMNHILNYIITQFYINYKINPYSTSDEYAVAINFNLPRQELKIAKIKRENQNHIVMG